MQEKDYCISFYEWRKKREIQNYSNDGRRKMKKMK